ncbi:DUF4810 domain-containing protein [uncultured Treponema sp.]|uniref:DUF4810 domain-containing protein n=1 Tax=uncultured Treponema sp. TaxID=162155 RepID=UPI0025DBD674|nr:DUF4810 domain-containing protein [uncultured Treponema sp.]
MKKSLVNAIKIAVISSIALLAISCSSTELYSWYNYQSDYYHYLKNADEKSQERLLQTYQVIITKQKDIRGVVPPGIYADYGWLLLQNGKAEEGKAMLMKEIELYPESEVFVGTLLKRYAQ